MYVKRNGQNEVVGAVRWPHDDYLEEMETTHPDYVAYQERINALPPESPGRKNLRNRDPGTFVTVADLKAAGLL